MSYTDDGYTSMFILELQGFVERALRAKINNDEDKEYLKILDNILKGKELYRLDDFLKKLSNYIKPKIEYDNIKGENVYTVRISPETLIRILECRDGYLNKKFCNATYIKGFEFVRHNLDWEARLLKEVYKGNPETKFGIDIIIHNKLPLDGEDKGVTVVYRYPIQIAKY